MEMGKLTAKLRDAVPVCFLVEGKEIKRYKNIDIPDELKKLEYQDFKFDVPTAGPITFKIMFNPGVLPEEFPTERERRTRKSIAQEAQPQEAAPATAVTAEAETELHPQDEQATKALPEAMVEAFAHMLENAQATGKPVADIAAAMVDGEAIKAEIVELEGEERLVVITVEPEAMEAMPEPLEATTEAKVQPEDSKPAKKPVRKYKGKKSAASMEDADE